jgi:hypothetical protein
MKQTTGFKVCSFKWVQLVPLHHGVCWRRLRLRAFVQVRRALRGLRQRRGGHGGGHIGDGCSGYDRDAGHVHVQRGAYRTQGGRGGMRWGCTS